MINLLSICCTYSSPTLVEYMSGPAASLDPFSLLSPFSENITMRSPSPVTPASRVAMALLCYEVIS